MAARQQKVKRAGTMAPTCRYIIVCIRLVLHFRGDPVLRAAVAAVFVIPLGVYLAAKRWRKRRGRVHFIPDSNGLGWRESTRSQSEVRISGNLTYDGPIMLHVQNAWVIQLGSTPH